jgi:lysine 2,3-aminomutase
MDSQKPYCPIRRQSVPTIYETLIAASDMVDPLNEEEDSPVPGLVHRYPDRVLLLVTDNCAVYCRHCTRRRIVGSTERCLTGGSFQKALEYIRANRKIRDVLLSGGDPFLLSDEQLDGMLLGLRQIPHVEFVRIGTRVPITLPQRITPEFVALLKKHAPLFMSVHVNHPKEITRRSRRALELLADAGIPLGSQTVLLRGINDRLYIMKKLMHELLKCRVRPYYVYHCDQAQGISHFRTPLSVGINIMEKLRGFTSGYAVPQYVFDAPGGAGKIPVSPRYVESQSKNVYLLRNYEGKVFTYTDEKEPATATIAATTPMLTDK